jgi:hypothetical protein
MRPLLFMTMVLLGAASAQAAELTRVASSLEDKDPFGMFMNFTYDRTQDRAKLVREWYQAGTTEDISELRYTMIEQKLGIDLHIGLYKDIELHVGVPIVFGQDRSWGFAGGTTADNTSLYRNCSLANGSLCSTPGFGTGRLFDMDNGQASYRGGLGDVTAGLAFAPFVQAKDDTKPTWVIRFDYTAPTSALLIPQNPVSGANMTSPTNRGGMGDGVHRYKFSTAVSKKLGGVFEPYFGIHYTLPYKSGKQYSNCDDLSNPAMGHPENCNVMVNGVQYWSRDQQGVQPQHVGGFVFGSELTLFERADRFQRFAFDIRGYGTYHSEGRLYNEMSDLFGKLMYTSDYAEAGGQAGIVAQAAEFILLRAYARFGYVTEHFLTYENIGQDHDGNGVVDVTTHPDELNPSYDFRTDRVGRRFRMQEESVFEIMVTVNFNF